MAAVINTNYLSLVAQNNLNKSQSALGTAIERLSSGLRINSAKDDAAGMAIANRFTANVKGLTQAARNANDGISLAQTTEGAASEVNTHLQRIRELTVQASNGSYSQEQLNSMQDEINQRLSDIDRISQQTDFNGVKVLSGNAKPLTLQVGANDGETITLNLTEISVKTLGLDGFNVNGVGQISNRKANQSDLVAAGGAPGGGGVYTVTHNNAAVKAEDAFARLTDGNTVTVDDGTNPAVTYKYDAKSGNFTFANSFTDTDKSATGATNTVAKLKNAIGSGAHSDVTITLGGESYTGLKIAADGSISASNGDKLFLVGDAATGYTLSANNTTTPGAAAGIDNTLDAILRTANASITVDGRKFTTSAAQNDGTTAGVIGYQDTISKADLLTKVKTNATGGTTTVALGDAVVGGNVVLNNVGASATQYVDSNGKWTLTATETVDYKVNADTGEVTVASAGENQGKTAYIGSNGQLTVAEKSDGKATKNPLSTLDAAFTKLDKLTGELGAVQNRLESTIANLNNVVNNLSSARSRIQDADYATEVSNMSKAQILQQAGTSVLAQANQVPQTVLSLLR
ncbi:FliC/FljB family flagellin [Achromobacter xylosoxidans]|jgi:flagellin